MTSAMTVDTTESRAPDRLRAASGPRAADLGAIRADLETLALELRALWPSALEDGDFEEVTRLVEASHAIHRAVVALSSDSLVSASRASHRLAGIDEPKVQRRARRGGITREVRLLAGR